MDTSWTVAPLVPPGLFFGLHQQFHWRRTLGPPGNDPEPILAMIFSCMSIICHAIPHKLYEAAPASRFICFAVVVFRVAAAAWRFHVLFLIGYGLARFIVEFFRQPDADKGYLLFNLDDRRANTFFADDIGRFGFNCRWPIAVSVWERMPDATISGLHAPCLRARHF